MIKIRDYKGCPRCTGRVYIREDIVELVQKKNIYLVSKKYTTLADKYSWKCNHCAYKWDTSANNVIYRTGCPKCSKVAPYSIKEIIEIARSKNLKFLSNECKNSSVKYRWQCLECNNINSAGVWNKTGCPKCAIENKKSTIANMHTLAEKRKLRFLSVEFLGHYVKHEWECLKCSRVYQLKPSNVQRGTSCRTCKLRQTNKERGL